jgi:hypothetical protein
MANRYFRNMVILAKVQADVGTYEAPAAATDALLISNATIGYDDQIVERDYLREFFGAAEQLIGDSPVNIEFEVELAGSGTAGTAPAWGKLLRACAFAETVSAGAHVIYNPITSDQESLSILYAVDGVTHRVKDARGTATLSIAPGSKASLKFKFVGIEQADPEALANPSGVVMTAWKAPLPVAADNTGHILIGGTYAAGVVTGGTALPSIGVDLDLGGSVEFMALMGSSEVDITGREIKGTAKMRLEAAAEVTMFTDAKAVTTKSVSFKHGVGAGKIVQCYAPACQFGRPKYENAQGRLAVSVDMRLCPVSGNDELLIIVK